MAAVIEISEPAARKIRQMIEERGQPQGGLRLGVKGGGCSGLSYVVDWADGPARLDQVFEREGARVFVDPKSAMFLQGTVVDWQQTLMQTGFVFRNPNVKSSCGCGESFTV
ncbi:MAG TPA: iron-sulfur cluster assembly accessory protein [Anaeromyxobacteraceae bacterium]|nr:iron-sulfur cluster assembly accessory protein [Anaeromyxobacteraceae bacterium]